MRVLICMSIRLVAPLVLMGLVAIPTVVLAQAQSPRPAVFGGTATVGGSTAANGVNVSAWIDGKKVASTTVSGGNYAFSIAQPPGESFHRKTITFKVGNTTASETATWLADGGGILNLNAGSVARPAVFGGSARVNGAAAANGVIVTASIDGTVVASTNVYGGNYAFSISQPVGKSFAGKAITFRVGNANATETATWTADGGAVLNLNAGSVGPQAPPQDLPHVFKGEVFINGQPAEDGTLMYALIEGVAIPATTTRGGRFRLTAKPRPGQSFVNKVVEFWGTTVDGKQLRFPQTITWQPGSETDITLELNQQPAPLPKMLPDLPGLDIQCVMKVLGRVPASPKDMSPSETLRVARDCFIRGGGPGNQTRLDQEQERIEEERKLQVERDRLERDRLERERKLQGERDRLESDRLESERKLQEAQARLDRERLQQEQDRISLEREFEDKLRNAASEQDRQRIAQERQRMEEGLALERERMERERKLEEEQIQRERALQEQRAQLDKDRIQQEQERMQQEFSQEEERLRRQGEDQRLQQGLPPLPGDRMLPPGEGKSPPDSEPRSGSTRGFFTNSAIGSLGTANRIIDPTTLAVIGILLTLGATVIQMVKGS